jgi:hypothetical protein
MYWVGGEPLMYDIHWWTLEEMLKNGSNEKCYMRYNSNLSRVQFGDKNLYDYLPLYKDWMMCASIDGTGEIVEYIRTGIKWDKWLENFKQGLLLPNGKDKMVLDLTLTAPGMFSLKELFEFLLQLITMLCKHFYGNDNGQVNLSLLSPADFQSIDSLIISNKKAKLIRI